MPRADYVARKFGNRPGAYERVTAVGKSVGIPFAFDRITVQPNTVQAHRLLHHAEQAGVQDAVAEALFRAYFTAGADLTDNRRLGEIAAEAGLDAEAVVAYLLSDADRDEVLQADQYFRTSGQVNGVPYFIFNRKVGVSGAQEAEVLLDALVHSLAE